MDHRDVRRPDCFSAAQWDALTDDEQGEWWTDAPSSAFDHPLVWVKLWNRGILTRTEFMWEVLVRLSEGSVSKFAEQCPLELISQLREDVQNLPPHDDGRRWEGGVIFFAGIPNPLISDEEHGAVRAEDNRRFREGVRVFRAHFPDQA